MHRRTAMRSVPEAERSRAHAAAETAAEARLAAEKRVRDTKPTTLAGVSAQCEYLNEVGEWDAAKDIALDVLRRIAERQPDLAVA